MNLIKMMVALGLLASSGAQAASVSSAVTITATVTAACSITSTSIATLGFTYNVYSGSATTGNTTFKVACVKNTPFTITLGGTITNGVRTFSSAPTGSALKYSLSVTGPISGSTSGTVWSDASPTTPTTITSPSLADQTYTIAGSMAAGQDVSQGSYSDTVTLSINY